MYLVGTLGHLQDTDRCPPGRWAVSGLMWPQQGPGRTGPAPRLPTDPRPEPSRPWGLRSCLRGPCPSSAIPAPLSMYGGKSKGHRGTRTGSPRLLLLDSTADSPSPAPPALTVWVSVGFSPMFSPRYAQPQAICGVARAQTCTGLTCAQDRSRGGPLHRCERVEGWTRLAALLCKRPSPHQGVHQAGSRRWADTRCPPLPCT